jgi:20S proteasome subunit beta 5
MVYWMSVFYVGPDGWKEMALDGVGELHDKYYPVHEAPAEVESSEPQR